MSLCSSISPSTHFPLVSSTSSTPISNLSRFSSFSSISPSTSLSLPLMPNFSRWTTANADELKSLPSPSSLLSLPLMPRSSLQTADDEDELKSFQPSTLSPLVASPSSIEDDPFHSLLTPDPPLPILKLSYDLLNYPYTTITCSSPRRKSKKWYKKLKRLKLNPKNQTE